MYILYTVIVMLYIFSTYVFGDEILIACNPTQINFKL